MGAVFLPKHVPRSCRVGAAESGLLEPEAAACSKEVTRATRLPNNLFNIYNLGRLGSHRLSKRLDAIFDPSRIFV